MRLCLCLREHFNIVVNGVVRDSGGKDQSKTQMQNDSSVMGYSRNNIMCYNPKRIFI